MRPFVLEEARAGKPVQTRDGRAARIISFDRKDEVFPIVALVADVDGYEDAQCYTNTGHFYESYESDEDLIMVPVKQVGWINIYSNGIGKPYRMGKMYETKAAAEKKIMKIMSDDFYFVATAKVEWEEGGEE